MTDIPVPRALLEAQKSWVRQAQDLLAVAKVVAPKGREQ